MAGVAHLTLEVGIFAQGSKGSWGDRMAEVGWVSGVAGVNYLTSQVDLYNQGGQLAWAAGVAWLVSNREPD